jgi:oxygen-independent coproporphyrinogen-3 oxidase
LPRQKLSNVKHTLNLVNKLECNHISVYSLILEEDTPIYQMVSSGQVKLPKEEKSLNMYNYTYNYLKTKGYNRYEVSNFAKDGFECEHNLHTWQMQEYIGIGSGAHGYLAGIRYNNISTIEEYISILSKNTLPIENKEKISKQEIFEETIMLGLRTKYGLDLKLIKDKFNKDLINDKNKEINELLENKLIIIENDYLKATDLGFTVLNKIILDLI